jgi:hypothetical protein
MKLIDGFLCCMQTFSNDMLLISRGRILQIIFVYSQPMQWQYNTPFNSDNQS